MVTRRRFLQVSAAALGASMLSSVRWPFDSSVALAFYQSPNGIQKFIQPLRGVFPLDQNGIPVAVPDGTKAPVTGATHYKIDISQYTDKLHPSLGPTTLRGYKPQNALGGAVPQRHLGGIIVANRGTPVQITFTNKLSGAHPIPIDRTLMGADLGDNRADTHLHGGFVPWISDGGPFSWFAPQGGYGASVLLKSKPGNIFKVLNPNLQPGQAEYYYPNNQSARMVWYHDHTVGITRMNAYVGIASAYIIRDAFESNLRNQGLPDFIENGGREIPIVIQDKIFVGSNINGQDPTWTGPTSPGSLWYPHLYETDRWDLGVGLAVPTPTSVIPEMFGDTMLANGTVYPEATVEARRYRLRILNACQARFLNLQLYVDDGSPDGITLQQGTGPYQYSIVPSNAKGPDFLVLGTEGGFLAHPVLVPSNQPMKYLPEPPEPPDTVDPADPGGSLITGPAVRWDVLVDFSGFAGKKIILYNDAPAPYPGGDPINDYYPGSPNPTRTAPGFGPNTRQIMRFNVVPATSADPALTITPATDLSSGIDPSLVRMWTSTPLPPPPGAKVRKLTLNEVYDQYGRLIQMLGTNEPVALPAGFTDPDGTPDYPPNNYARTYDSTPTETPKAGATEVWQIANLTGDTHPMHFHLVNVQVLSRQSFTDSDGNYLFSNGVPTFTAPARGPLPTELGWKETVHMNPGELTTVIMEFNLPKVPFSVPASPRTGGNEYVWHCHILEHEEHDMMRPLIVT